MGLRTPFGPWFKTWVDVLKKLPQYLLVGEVKSSLNRKTMEIAETELEEKVQRLPLKDGYEQVLTKVFCLEAKRLRNKDRKSIGGDDILRVLK